jgi:hypothetical protein
MNNPAPCATRCGDGPRVAGQAAAEVGAETQFVQTVPQAQLNVLLVDAADRLDPGAWPTADPQRR